MDNSVYVVMVRSESGDQEIPVHAYTDFDKASEHKDFRKQEGWVSWIEEINLD